MTAKLTFLALCASATASAFSMSSKGAAISKVIQMLGDMKQEGLAEKQKEKIEFAKFSTNCANMRKTKAREIKAHKLKMSKLDSVIVKATDDSEQAGVMIEKLTENIGKVKGERADASALRKKEKADYRKTNVDYEESIDALKRATDKPEESADRNMVFTQLEALTNTQKLSMAIRNTLKRVLLHADVKNMSLQEPKAYEKKASSGVIGLLEKLESKFVDEKRNLEKEESAKNGEHQLLVQNMGNQIANDEEQLNAETERKAEKDTDKGEAEADLAKTLQAFKEDEKMLNAENQECEMRSKEYDMNQKVRSEEIVAITKAIEIMDESSVSKTHDKAQASGSALIQETSADEVENLIGNAGVFTSFLQVSSASDAMVNKRRFIAKRLTKFLKDALTKEEQHSSMKMRAVLAFLQSAAHGGAKHLMAAQADPMKKVSKMIEDMILKLMEEANAEEEEHGFCQTEITENKITREDKTKLTEKLSSKMDENNAKIDSLSQDVKDLNESIAALQKQVATATEARNENSASNKASMKEAQAAEFATNKAIQVLEEFYGSSGEESFLQTKSNSNAPYTGMGGASGGVIGLLTTIASDFARLQTDTEMAENAEAKQHRKFTDEATEDIALKTTEVEHKDKNTARLKKDLTNFKKDFEAADKELKVAVKYNKETIEPSSDIFVTLFYEDKVAAREKEIQSLKEALEILDQ